MIKRSHLFLILLAILTLCDCQEQPVYHIKPDNCQQEECCPYPPPDCMTLSEYALNINKNNQLELSPGEYQLNSNFHINGTSTQSFSMFGSDSTIICTQKVTFEFSNFSTLTVKNVSFVSCGVDTVPSVSLTNIDTVNLVDTSFSNSTFGALHIQNCRFVQLTNLKIANNVISHNVIVSVINSANIALRNLHVINNSVGTFDSSCAYRSFPNADEVMFRIDGGSIDTDNILVTDNIGPFGVLVITNAVVTVNGDWRFERNQVCVGGSLAFVKTTVDFNGNLYFIENKGINEVYQSTAGLQLKNNATLDVSGSMEFVGNVACIACVHIILSKLFISNGSLNMSRNLESFQVASFNEGSSLIINGSLIVHNNQLVQRAILSEVSNITVNGFVSFINNPRSPIALYSGTLIMNGEIIFQNNAGAIYGSRSKVIICGNSIFTRNDIEDEYKDGLFAIVETSLTMDGKYIFKDTRYDDEDGGGIWATVTSTVTLSGIGYFINNTANNGGGIFIDQLSRLELNEGTRLHFINNTAVRGAGIYIDTTLRQTKCQYNPNQCLIKVKENVSLVFQDNNAYPGASAIHVSFDHIENSNIEYPALDELNQTVDVSSFTGNSPPHYSSDSYWFCFCEDNSREKCIRDDSTANITAYKGKTFSVKARVLKFYGANTSEPVRATLESSLSAIGNNSLGNSVLTTNNGRLQSVSATECSILNFTVKSTAENELILLNVGETFVDNDKSLKVNIHFRNFCPPGFPLSKSKDSCECDKSIRNFLQNCENIDQTFKKRIEYIFYWMAPSNDPQYQGAMNWYIDCPNRYCITDGDFTFSDDGICANNRTGLLCGQCKGNYSLLLGGDLCGDCSNNSYLALIVVFAVAGVLLVAFIFLTQITVTTGTINGLIFYANILNSNQSVFFPEGFFPGYHIFISWLNLNFGFETCFFDGMDQIFYAGLQFVFPLYMWFLAGVVIILCRYSIKVSKFFGTSDPVAVLATIILLSFNSLAQNVISIFYFSTLNLPEGHSSIVWRYDGNVSYISGAHFALFIIAAVFLLFLLMPYIFMLFLAPFLQKSECISKIFRKLRLQPFIHAYLIPLKHHHRYWIGLSLLTRAILLIIFAFGESRQLDLLLIVTTCVVAISTFAVTGGIYDKKWLDMLEISFLVNLGVLAAAVLFSFSFSVNGHEEIATYISITVALLTFIGIIILHVFLQLKKFPMLNEKIEIIAKKFKHSNTAKSQELVLNELANISNSEKTTITSASYQIKLREPLLDS